MLNVEKDSRSTIHQRIRDLRREDEQLRLGCLPWTKVILHSYMVAGPGVYCVFKSKSKKMFFACIHFFNTIFPILFPLYNISPNLNLSYLLHQQLPPPQTSMIFKHDFIGN